MLFFNYIVVDYFYNLSHYEKTTASKCTNINLLTQIETVQTPHYIFLLLNGAFILYYTIIFLIVINIFLTLISSALD